MTWYPTNTDDVTLIVSQVLRDDSGTRTGTAELANTSAVVVDDFSIDTEEDMEALSGVGNAEALGISKGDIEHNFSFTIQGEDAEVFNGLASNEDGRAVELEIIFVAEDYKDKLTGAYAGTRNVSGSSGDPLEFEAEGVATGRTPGTVEG
jgi:hypothetical protein